MCVSIMAPVVPSVMPGLQGTGQLDGSAAEREELPLTVGWKKLDFSTIGVQPILQKGDPATIGVVSFLRLGSPKTDLLQPRRWRRPIKPTDNRKVKQNSIS
jgi:hypothetical protein